MRTNNWHAALAAAVVVSMLLGGCGPMHRLKKQNPEVGVRLPARSAAAEPVQNESTPSIITYRKQDGKELFFAPGVVDSLTGETLMSVAIDEVLISAGARRNLVERNGKINVEFIVTVPEVLQDRSWQLRLDPQLNKGSETQPLAPLVYSGERFRTMQQRQYDRYQEYRNLIVDSTEYFDRFGRHGAYERYMNYLAGKRDQYADDYSYLMQHDPRQVMCDKEVGWLTRRERDRQLSLLKGYVRTTDTKASRVVTYTPNAADPYDHLNDYLTPRYRYSSVDVLPGGGVYTRVDGQYPRTADRRRERYLQQLADSLPEVHRGVRKADIEGIRQYASERMNYTGHDSVIEGLLRETSDSAMLENYRIRRGFAGDQKQLLENLDTAAIQAGMLRSNLVARNNLLAENREAVFSRLVRHPYPEEPRLDTVIRRVDGSLAYYYTEEIAADENTSKLHLYLAGGVESRGGNSYLLQKSDTLTYNVASMTTFLDPTPRYMQRIITRDAEANARFFFTFPLGRSELDTLRENRIQVKAVRDLTRSLMTDPVYIIDSIRLLASASPEGNWDRNERLARERAEALRKVLVAEFRVLYDSLKVAATVSLDAQGRQVMTSAREELPNLPNLLRSQWLAEDWDRLYRLTLSDEQMPDKAAVLDLMKQDGNPDKRERQIRHKYPRAYERMSRVHYPQLRAVDFRFNLHRRGMQQDTVYTTELDSNYMHAVELLRKRRYEPALEILRPYEDRNTALAYMSLGYDAAAYRILKGVAGARDTADIEYMLAILAARLGDEQQAVQYFLRSVELRENLRFRGNLDPEIARLIRKYGLFLDEF